MYIVMQRVGIVITGLFTSAHLMAIELTGLGIIKDSAEIIANSIASFPTKQMVIAIIGFIGVSQGLLFFMKGLASFLCGEGYHPTHGTRVGHIRGVIQCLIGLGLATAGALSSLYSAKIVHYLFGL